MYLWKRVEQDPIENFNTYKLEATEENRIFYFKIPYNILYPVLFIERELIEYKYLININEALEQFKKQYQKYKILREYNSLGELKIYPPPKSGKTKEANIIKELYTTGKIGGNGYFKNVELVILGVGRSLENE